VCFDVQVRDNYIVYPSAEDLIDGGRLLERALGLNDRPHLLHVEHERVQRLLDVVLLVLACKKRKKRVIFGNEPEK
jgi:hypothetical protein